MSRIRYWAPSIALATLSAAVLLGGPRVARHLAYAQQAARIELARDRLQTLKSTKLAELSESFREVARVMEPSVVHISTARRFSDADLSIPPSTPEELRRYFERRRAPDLDDPPAPLDPLPTPSPGPDVPQDYGSGSGWVYPDGRHIVTNLHVVEGADQIRVRFYDKTERLAFIVGADPQTDIAVLKLRQDHAMHPARIADEALEQGDIVFAFGSPFQFEFSMSQGIVSQKERRLGILGSTGYESFIQTDAAINPGNSGGPLTNIYGEVIGMNSAIATRTGGSQGIGFAIPSSMIRSVVEQLIEKGEVRRGYLGVEIKTLTAKMAATYGYDGEGVLVTRVEPGMPAHRAGLEAGDIIAEVAGQPVATEQDLRNLVAAFPPDSDVKLKLFRKGESFERSITLADQHDSPWVSGLPTTRTPGVGPEGGEIGVGVLRLLGIERARSLTAEQAAKIGVGTAGVLVERVRAGSVAAAEGLRPGTIITAVMDEPVQTVDALIAALGKHDIKAGVRVRVQERDYEDFVVLAIP